MDDSTLAQAKRKTGEMGASPGPSPLCSPSTGCPAEVGLRRSLGNLAARPTPRLGRIHARFLQAPPRRVLPFGTYPAKVEGTSFGPAGMGGAIVDHLNVSSLAGADPATAAESGRSGKCFF